MSEIRSALTPLVRGLWDVQVVETQTEYATVFTVGSQHFVIARGNKNYDGQHHCEGMKRMFLHALEVLGVNKRPVGEELLAWLMGLEGALETSLRRTTDHDSRVELRCRRGIYEGIAADIKNKWPQLFQPEDTKKG